MWEDLRYNMPVPRVVPNWLNVASRERILKWWPFGTTSVLSKHNLVNSGKIGRKGCSTRNPDGCPESAVLAQFDTT